MRKGRKTKGLYIEGNPFITRFKTQDEVLY